MADTSQVKKDIRDIVKRLGQEFNKEFDSVKYAMKK